MAHNAELGRRGEQLAVDHLEARGMAVLERNWRCRLGEIDIVARDRGDLVFIEVKTRSNSDCGHPFEAITPIKLGACGGWPSRGARRASRRRQHPHRRGRRARARGVSALIEHLKGIS